MAELRVRWSEHEARKTYARPFGVSFNHAGSDLGSIAVSGHELLYYRQFQTAVLLLAGEIFAEPVVETSPEPQSAWLDLLEGVLPGAPVVALLPQSDFADHEGRVFRFRLASGEPSWAIFAAATVLDYQEFQASMAHQTGRLFRSRAVEAVGDDVARQRLWLAEAATMVSPPDSAEALAPDWPWRPLPTRP